MPATTRVKSAAEIGVGWWLWMSMTGKLRSRPRMHGHDKRGARLVLGDARGRPFGLSSLAGTGPLPGPNLDRRACRQLGRLRLLLCPDDAKCRGDGQERQYQDPAHLTSTLEKY